MVLLFFSSPFFRNSRNTRLGYEGCRNQRQATIVVSVTETLLFPSLPPSFPILVSTPDIPGIQETGVPRVEGIREEGLDDGTEVGDVWTSSVTSVGGSGGVRDAPEGTR